MPARLRRVRQAASRALSAADYLCWVSAAEKAAPLPPASEISAGPPGIHLLYLARPGRVALPARIPQRPSASSEKAGSMIVLDTNQLREASPPDGALLALLVKLAELRGDRLALPR